MSDKIALVYWPDTTGHAARSVPVAQEIERRGHELVIGGGGFGQKFLELNGFEPEDMGEFEVFPDSGSLILHTLFDTFPSWAKRFGSLISWLREEEPDKVVTDDIFCLIGATLLGIDYYRIENWEPEMFDFPISSLYKVYDKFTITFGDKIVLTSLWPEEEAGKGRERVGPLAQEGEEDVEPYDVLLMPGSFGEEFGRIREKLEQKGFQTEMVGADDWELKASMTPYTEAADCILCTGFSSIADSVVGGTHCIVYPHLFLQKGIARGISNRYLNGIETVYSSEEAYNSLLDCLGNSCEEPDYENGAKAFVDVVED